MMLGLTRAVFIVAMVAATSRTAWAVTPPMECRRAHTVVARAICASPDLMAMDREIAALNDRGMAQFGPDDQRQLARSQLAFFQHRNGCSWAAHHSAHPGPAVGECVRADMDDRVRVLRSAIDRGNYGRR